MSNDDLDQPESEKYDLAVPFIVCQSQGGPFDDDAFLEQGDEQHRAQQLRIRKYRFRRLRFERRWFYDQRHHERKPFIRERCGTRLQPHHRQPVRRIR